ncbi:hypothetical protein GJU89_12290 [Brucella sp. 09RB8918]|nr:hypothetical protein [Brucella sp. 09RB8913]MRN59763.1 hypothetical protein [Brucella sp. 09RB8918]
MYKHIARYVIIGFIGVITYAKMHKSIISLLVSTFLLGGCVSDVGPINSLSLQPVSLPEAQVDLAIRAGYLAFNSNPRLQQAIRRIQSDAGVTKKQLLATK